MLKPINFSDPTPTPFWSVLSCIKQLSFISVHQTLNTVLVTVVDRFYSWVCLLDSIPTQSHQVLKLQRFIESRNHEKLKNVCWILTKAAALGNRGLFCCEGGGAMDGAPGSGAPIGPPGPIIPILPQTVIFCH